MAAGHVAHPEDVHCVRDLLMYVWGWDRETADQQLDLHEWSDPRVSFVGMPGRCSFSVRWMEAAFGVREIPVRVESARGLVRLRADLRRRFTRGEPLLRGRGVW